MKTLLKRLGLLWILLITLSLSFHAPLFAETWQGFVQGSPKVGLGIENLQSLPKSSQKMGDSLCSKLCLSSKEIKLLSPLATKSRLGMFFMMEF
ncbi:MAG: hypothetical protein KDK66_05725 [Deltaproteobacteria bacterium]|nr:hypothetical protein [Deltaproteobacteria bacterium]